MNPFLLQIPASRTQRAQTVDFRHLLEIGIDDIVAPVVNVLRDGLEDVDWATRSLYTSACVWRRSFLPWLAVESERRGQSLTLHELDAPLFVAYIADLRQQKKYSTAQGLLCAMVPVLRRLASIGLMPTVDNLLPANPFPGAGASKKATPPYTLAERKALIQALAGDYREVVEGAFNRTPHLQVDGLVVCLLLIAFQSGFNLTPLLELHRDALEPHPVKTGMYMLKGFKRRGNRDVSAVSMSVPNAGPRNADLISVFNTVLRLTAPYVDLITPEYRDHLFIRPPYEHGHFSFPAMPFLYSDVGQAMGRLSKRYAIAAHDGGLLRLGLRRIRATLAARVMELSKGDPLVVAAVLGNQPQTASVSYMTPDFDAPAAFARAVDAFVERLSLYRGQPEKVAATPVGGCTDPLHGRYAPRDGVTYCQRWLNCFRCPNQCLTSNDQDLWRAYSFYWLLQAESQRLKNTAISGLVRFVLHVMDSVLPDQFGRAALVAREKARREPHPFWARVRVIEAHDVVVSDASRQTA